MQIETKQLFPFRDLEGEDLIKDVMFRSQAKRFMNAIETTIHHLNALDLILAPVLHRLGEKHVKIPGFKIEYLSIFIEAMLDVFAEELGKLFTKEVRAAWKHLGRFIAGKMIEGYQDALLSVGKYLAQRCTVISTSDDTDGDNRDAINCGTGDSNGTDEANRQTVINACESNVPSPDMDAANKCTYGSSDNINANGQTFTKTDLVIGNKNAENDTNDNTNKADFTERSHDVANYNSSKDNPNKRCCGTGDTHVDSAKELRDADTYKTTSVNGIVLCS